MRLCSAPLVLVLGLLLAACGRSAAVEPTGATAPPPPALAPATPPPTIAPVATDRVATSGGLYTGIPQGRTPEGYAYLGAPDAPVTLVMYSDFL